MPGPLVSIIIPTFNRAYCVGKAIDSVLNQTHQNTEIILLDDGSTDGTREVIEECYGPDPARGYVFHENRGVTATRNRGITLCRGDFVALLDSDDTWCPWKLELQLACLHHRPELGMVWTDMRAVGPAGEVLSESFLQTMYHAYRWFSREELFPQSFPLAELAPGLAPIVGDCRLYTGEIFSQMIMGNLVHTSTVLLRRERPGEGPRVQRGAPAFGRGLRFPPADVLGGCRRVHRPGDHRLSNGITGSADTQVVQGPSGDQLFEDHPPLDRAGAVASQIVGRDASTPVGGGPGLGGRRASGSGPILAARRTCVDRSCIRHGNPGPSNSCRWP